ncbi:MAG: hypothetical protein ABII90_05185 [Bacteroidota bacterium]
MLKDTLIFIGIFLSGEIISYLVFYIIKNWLNVKEKSTFKASMKGHLERLILFVSLVNNIPQIFIVFGALKIGTRLKEEEGNKISNDYFLAGNFASILLAIIYLIVWKQLVH